ncbi:hypothetical protein H9Q74_013650 [Fusarium xylarioides]|nr:hypothetical protein H9Q71_014006 [Fusarium xylarioides]KAG5811261.1 hypothetical protein H9Q74_013650 [Fusarium xylarioides]
MNKFIIALAVASAVSAAPLSRRDECQDTYKKCIAAGTPEVACSCTLTACVGEDNARNRASATASLAQPTKTEIPGGCNPVHPGSCPSSYFTYSVVSKTAVQAVPAPTATEDCSEGTKPEGTYHDPKPVEGETWTIKDLTRYCGEGNEGCDYNFEIAADGKTERCTVIHMPGKDAATESWSNEPCTDGSEFTISWGYVTEPAPAFAVISVVKGKEIAWFGVSDVNGQKVTTTPSNPFGSGQFGDLGPEQVYTY